MELGLKIIGNKIVGTDVHDVVATASHFESSSLEMPL